MTMATRTDASALRIGFWSALVIAVEVTIFGISLLLPDALTIAFLASFLLAPTFVALMVGIHYSAPAEKKLWSHMGLSFVPHNHLPDPVLPTGSRRRRLFE